MFQVGDKVRLTNEGKEYYGIIGHGPKALRFFYGTHAVRYSNEEETFLHYPVGLDIEYAEFISEDRYFTIQTTYLERI